MAANGPKRCSRIALPLLLGLVGCGTTVPVTPAGSAAGGASLEQDGADRGGSAVADNGLGATVGANDGLSSGGSVAGSGPRADGQPGPASSTPTRSGAATTTGSTAKTFGVTATSIYVGIPYVANGNA